MSLFKLMQQGWLYSAGYGMTGLVWGCLGVAVAAYLLGSINTALVVSKACYGKDIRQFGSHNAGMTNMFRVLGKKAGVLTLIGDVLKAFLSVFIGFLLVGKHFGGPYVAAFFCVLGHVFPVYYRFRGGKGVLVAAISILCVDPLVFLFVALVFALMFFTIRIVSVASITAAAIYPLLSTTFSVENNFLTSVLFSLALSVFVIAMHRDNIRRLLNNEEKRVEFGKKKKVEASTQPAPKAPTRPSLIDDDDTNG